MAGRGPRRGVGITRNSRWLDGGRALSIAEFRIRPHMGNQLSPPAVEPQDFASEIALRLGERKPSPQVAHVFGRGRLFRRTLAALAWLYLLGLVLTWLLLWFATDRWWFATMMAFGPRWLYALPLLALVPACIIWGRRRWPVLVASGLILCFPIMDFRCPWGRVFSPSGTAYRVLTCNLHDDECDPAALKALVLCENPDFIALQECNFEAIRPAVEGYQVVQFGGLLIASRFPLHEEENASGAEPARAYPRSHILLCSADTPQGKLFLGCVHLPSPRYGLSGVLSRKAGIQPLEKVRLEEHIRVRREVSAAIAALVEDLPGPIILAGDFNTPVESAVYRDCWSSYHNAFSRTGFGFGQTYRAAVWEIPFGVRIDHILGGSSIVPSRCWIGSAVGSEHLPVLADMVRE